MTLFHEEKLRRTPLYVGRNRRMNVRNVYLTNNDVNIIDSRFSS